MSGHSVSFLLTLACNVEPCPPPTAPGHIRILNSRRCVEYEHVMAYNLNWRLCYYDSTVTAVAVSLKYGNTIGYKYCFRSNWITNDWSSPTGLPRDPPLAAFGEAQSKEVADYFKSLPEDQRPTAIFSSPYYRCLQTSHPTAIALGIPIYAEHGLSEWYSPVSPGTGLHPRPSSASALKAYVPEIDDSWPSVWYPSRRGEGVAALHDRLAGFATAFVPEIERRFSAAAHKRILLVSHAATVVALARELVGDRALLFRAACCSITVLDRKDTSPAGDSAPSPRTIVGDWTARLLGGGAHLKDGLQRPWGFQDAVIIDGEVITDDGIPGTEHEQDEPVGSQVVEILSRM